MRAARWRGLSNIGSAWLRPGTRENVRRPKRSVCHIYAGYERMVVACVLAYMVCVAYGRRLQAQASQDAEGTTQLGNAAVGRLFSEDGAHQAMDSFGDLAALMMSLIPSLAFSPTHGPGLRSIAYGDPAHHRTKQVIRHRSSRGFPSRITMGPKSGPARCQPKSIQTAGQLPVCTLAAPVHLEPPFTVLGIETSCDDTGVAVVSSDSRILGEALASQAALHEEFGGVMPAEARDAHVRALNKTIALAVANAGLSSVADVDAVAVTVGPGLEICLRVGCETAKALARHHAKPFVAVHHLEGHLLMARLACEQPPTFPFLTLLLSGGHCQLLLTTGLGEHRVIGSTLDDALGEAYDKVARLLGLPIGGGGGPALEALAREGNASAIPLPVPMSNKRTFDFSFAGLKTAVRRAIELTPEDVRNTSQFRADVAASFQHVAILHIEQRLKYAMQLCSEQASAWGKAPSTLVLSGGVAANAELRRRLNLLCDQTPAPGGGKWQMRVPPPRLCTDNGVMIAWAAIEALSQGKNHVVEGQEVRARWPLGPKETSELEPKSKKQRKREAWRKRLEELDRLQVVDEKSVPPILQLESVEKHDEREGNGELSMQQEAKLQPTVNQHT